MQLNVKALTITFALIWGGAVLLVGLANMIWPSYGVAFLAMIASIYPGVRMAGFGAVIVATLYALVDGAVWGAIVAWLYNRIAAPVRPQA